MHHVGQLVPINAVPLKPTLPEIPTHDFRLKHSTCTNMAVNAAVPQTLTRQSFVNADFILKIHFWSVIID